MDLGRCSCLAMGVTGYAVSGYAESNRRRDGVAKMTAPEIQAQIVGFILLALPLIAALWKFFNLLQGIEKRLDDAVDRVDRRVGELEHLAAMRELKVEALNDRLMLGINGTKELVNHLRTRTKADDDQLRSKLDQIERYLVKETNYQSRE